MAERLILLATDDGLHCLHLSGRRVLGRLRLPADEAGRVSFERLLDALDEVPVTLLFDSVDEEIDLDTVPRAHGHARREMLQRRLQQTFPNARYRLVRGQGRPDGQKRKEEVACHALTDDGVIAPWLKIIDEKKTCLTGVHSVALLGHALLKLIAAKERYVLLITRQPDGTLRQSFFDHGRMKMTRLTAAIPPDEEKLEAFYLGEATATRQYLGSVRLLPRDAALHVHIVHRPGRNATVAGVLQQMDDFHLHLHSLDNLLAKLGLRHPQEPDTDLLFSALALGRGNRFNFAQSPQLRPYRLRLAGRALLAVGWLGAAAAVVLAGWQLSNTYALREQSALNRSALAALQARLAHAQRHLPAAQVAPEQMRAVVELVMHLRQHQHLPDRALAALGERLQRFPDVALTSLDWRAGNAGGIDAMSLSATQARSGAAFANQPPAFLENLAAGAADRGQWLEISGEVTNFGNDYRHAHGRVQSLVADLAAHHFDPVQATRTPLDVRPRERLAGQVGQALQGQARHAAFTIRARYAQEAPG